MFEFQKNRSKKIALACLTVLIGIGLALLQIFADPFGLPSSVDRINSVLFSALLSPYYGESITDENKNIRIKGRDDIVVLLYDDQYLKREGLNWPINPRRHRQFLQKIEDADPQAVFVDLYYGLSSKKREKRVAQLYEFGNRLNGPEGCSSKGNETKIVFASMLGDTLPSANGTSPNCVALANMITDEYQYALTQNVKDEDGIIRVLPTAAYQLYKIWCATRVCPSLSDDVESKVLFIQWGYAPSEDMQLYYLESGISCQKPGTNLISKFGRSIYLFFVKALSGFSQDWRPNCLYHTHTSMGLVQDLSTEELAKRIEGKIVLIGTDLINHADYSSSTVHGKVPGVFWHAAALDNLMVFGNNFLHEIPSDSVISAEVFANVFVILVFVIFRFYLSALPQLSIPESEKIGLMENLNFWFGTVMLIFLSLLVASLISITHRAPTNWIGIAALLFVVNPEPFRSVFRVYWYGFVDGTVNVLGRDPREPGMQKLGHYIRRLFCFTCKVLSAVSLFLLPTIYFTINPNASFVIYGLFITIYLLLLGLALIKYFNEISILKTFLNSSQEMPCTGTEP